MATKIDDELIREVLCGEDETLPARLERLLSRGADPNYRDKNGKTSLHLLLSRKRANVTDGTVVPSIHILLSNGASVDMTDHTGKSVIHLAAAKNMPAQILSPLLAKCNISEMSTAAVCDLMSTDCLNDDLLVSLCRSGVDLLLSNRFDITAIHCMVKKHRPSDAALIHTLARERCNDFNTIKNNLLLYVCKHGSKATLQGLLQLGASNAGKDKDSGLPAVLLVASSVEDQEAVERVGMLVTHGADICMTSSTDQNLCHIAAILHKHRLLKFAVARGVDHTYHDQEGSTPLHYACASANNSDAISILLDAGLDITEPNADGLTPLYIAVTSKDVNNISQLIKASVDVRNAGLESCFSHDLQLLGEPQVIRASPRPLEYVLVLSSFYNQMAQVRPKLKDNYIEMSVQMEDTAIEMIEKLHSLKLQRLALHEHIVEMAILNGRKKFIASEAVQDELTYVWQGCETSCPKLIVAMILFLLQAITRPFVIFIALPLILFDVKFCGFYISWDILRPQTSPKVWYFTEAIAYFVFFLLLIFKSFEHESHKLSLTTLEWMLLVYVIALLYNDLLTLYREGFRFYFKRLSHKRNIFGLLLFLVFYVTRAIAIHSDDHRSLFLRISSYMLALATTLSSTRLLQYLRVNPLFGPLQKSYSKIQQSLITFLVILLIYMLAFATALSNIYGAASLNANYTENCPPAAAFQDVFSSGQSLFWSLFGMTELNDLCTDGDCRNDYCTGPDEIVGKIVFGLWLIQASIILLNMLIAIITNKFDEVQGNADCEWKFSLGATILDVQKSQRVPVPINLLHIFIDLVDLVANTKEDTKWMRERSFHLQPLADTLQHTTKRKDALELQIAIFTEAEEKKWLHQPSTKEDLHTINQRLLKIEALLSSGGHSRSVHPAASVATSDEANDKDSSSFQNRIRLWTESFEHGIDSSLQSNINRRNQFKKSLFHKMLQKENTGMRRTSTVRTQDEHNETPTSHAPNLQLQPVVEETFELTTTNSQLANVTQTLIGLKECVQQQGQMLLQIQLQLANTDKRMNDFESSQSTNKRQLHYVFEEELV